MLPPTTPHAPHLQACCRFATEAGVMDLVDLGTDTQGRLRLTKALPALAERCAAQGRVEGVAALLVFAEEGTSARKHG